MRTRFVIPLLAAIVLLPAVAMAGDEEDIDAEIQEAMKGVQAGQTVATPAELETMAKSILKEMAVVRELPIKGPVAMEVATRDQIVKYVESRQKEDMKGDQLIGQEAALKRLALIPEAMDMRKFLLDLYGEQVAGYYDPFKQKFFIASWMASSMQGPIMAHELTHALQDQHFNLKPFLTPVADNSDFTRTRLAIAEGDATIALFAYLGSKTGTDMTTGMKVGPMLRSSMASSAYPIFQGAPAYFQEALFYPYCAGSDFVVAVKDAGGWKKVTALYANLPKSSEQVLHPEKYLDPKLLDEPTAVEMPISISGWRQIYTDVLGEVDTRVMFDGYFEPDEAAKIAAGWDGDRYRAFQKGARTVGAATGTVVVMRSIWDSATEAKEFADGYKRLLAKKYEGSVAKDLKDPKDARAGATLVTTVEDGVTRVEIRGAEVVIVDGAPDKEAAEKFTALAWGKSS